MNLLRHFIIEETGDRGDEFSRCRPESHICDERVEEGLPMECRLRQDGLKLLPDSGVLLCDADQGHKGLVVNHGGTARPKSFH